MYRPQYRIRFVLVACIAAVALAFLLMVILFVDPPFLLFAPYLMPAVLLVLVTVLTPIAILSFCGRFSLLHPLVYAAWSYFLPVFVVGSMVLVTGLSQPWYLPLVGDLKTNLPRTLYIVALGFASLSMGFALPFGRKAGSYLSLRLPRWNWPFDRLVIPSLIMILLGEVSRFQALAVGAVGYQMAESPSAIGNVLTSFAALSNLAMFSLWYALFRTAKWHLRHFAAVGLLLALVGYWVLVSGSKGNMFWSAVLIFMALVLSGRKVSLRTSLLAVGVAVFVLVGGFTYGMAFRSLKGSEATMSPAEYFDLGIRTVSSISPESMWQDIESTTEAILLRLEMTGQVAVIAANYENLRPLEVSYGIDNNIWTYTWTAFIPRFLWPDKPLVSDARAIAAIYFNFPNNSFAITPMGDLLRNYGVIGVPLGMGLLGIGLAVVYYALFATATTSTWRAATYYAILVGFTYESFYGTILPGFVRNVFVAFVFGWGLDLATRIKIKRPGHTQGHDDVPHLADKSKLQSV